MLSPMKVLLRIYLTLIISSCSGEGYFFLVETSQGFAPIHNEPEQTGSSDCAQSGMVRSGASD